MEGHVLEDRGLIIPKVELVEVEKIKLDPASLTVLETLIRQMRKKCGVSESGEKRVTLRHAQRRRRERREQVKQLWRLKMRPAEMAQELGVSKRTIQQDQQAIREETREFVYESIKRNDMLTMHRMSIEVLEDRQRKLLVIESDRSIDPHSRIEASRLIAEIELEIHRLIPYERMMVEKFAAAKTLEEPARSMDALIPSR